MCRFTADEALELEGTEDAIMVDYVAASRICRDHGVTLSEYLADLDDHTPKSHYDAGHLLGWLGY